MVAYVIKLQAPFERLKGYSDCPEVNLRRAIILQAIIDATNTSRNRAARQSADEAAEWLFSGGEHFTKTCLEAELEPQNVMRVAREMIDLQYAKYRTARRNTTIFTDSTKISIRYDETSCQKITKHGAGNDNQKRQVIYN